MRLWTLHPDYLDSKGIVALWREALGAQRNILGLTGILPKTKGYNDHPQLKRFMESKNPVLAIRIYLFQIYLSAKKRGYNFDIKLIHWHTTVPTYPHYFIPVTMGQVVYEACHLNKKIKARKGHSCFRNLNLDCDRLNIELISNPLFIIKPDWRVESWEKIQE